MTWMLAGFVLPMYAMVEAGAGYGMAALFFGAGVVLHFVNVGLIRIFLEKRAPETIEDGSWELTAGTGIVPNGFPPWA